MVSCYKCEKCGKVFENYEEAYKHENRHFYVKSWVSSEDSEVINNEMEYSETQEGPSAVVVPMERTTYDEDKSEWVTEVIYMKYYGDKRPAVQVFHIDKNLLTDGH